MSLIQSLIRSLISSQLLKQYRGHFKLRKYYTKSKVTVHIFYSKSHCSHARLSAMISVKLLGFCPMTVCVDTTEMTSAS